MRKSQNSYVSDNLYQVERNDNCPCGSGRDAKKKR
ncbi:SEC-C metal-binding domain-containing protein [Neomoorella humiferrea]